MARMRSTFVHAIGFAALWSAALGALFTANAADEGQLPPPANVKVDFDRDIRPILDSSCLQCHVPPKPKSHFRLDSRAAALQGGDDNTNDIVPGDSDRSLLIHYVAQQVPDMEMPPPGKGEPLTVTQISLLRAWIDQGALWSATNQYPQLAFSFTPTLGWIGVHGDQNKFRQIEGVKEGFSGGVEEFSATQQTGPDEKLTLQGHVNVPNHDYTIKLDLDKNDLGFVHTGFEEWREYYDDLGGFDPAVIGSPFHSDRDLHLDDGRAWIDFGLTLPHWPLIVLGYEYQFRNGNEATLDWGTVSGKNILPATQSVDEHTHIIKLSLSQDIHDWHWEDNARVEFYQLNRLGSEADNLFGGASPDTFISTRDQYHSTQGMNTLLVEKQVFDWWYLSGGFYFSRLDGSDLFNQTNAIPQFGVATILSSAPITLHRQSEIFSVASLFTPLKYLTFSIGSQNEWTREDGFGSSVPDLENGLITLAQSSTDTFHSSQNAQLRFLRIPFTVLFAEGRFDQESIGEFQEEDPDQFTRHADYFDHRYDFQTGFNTSPWRWFALNAKYEKQDSDTDYSNPVDIYNGNSSVSNGYPGFILNRKIHTDEFETKLSLRPASWLKTTLTYQISDTTYSSVTDPAFDYSILLQEVSPGGPITDGHYHAQTYGLSATLTPIRRLYFSGAFTYSKSRATTANNGDTSIVPYERAIFTPCSLPPLAC